MSTETQLEQRVAALQSDLNARDQALDDAATENNEREFSQRDWFEAAQAAEKPKGEPVAYITVDNPSGRGNEYSLDWAIAAEDLLECECP